jgi:hypothetical protein
MATALPLGLPDVDTVFFYSIHPSAKTHTKNYGTVDVVVSDAQSLMKCLRSCVGVQICLYPRQDAFICRIICGVTAGRYQGCAY